MMKRGGMKRKLGTEHNGAAVKGRPVVVHGSGYGRKGRKMRGRGMR